MENVSIHAAAIKAIEWFHIDPGALSANTEAEGERESDESRTDAPSTTRPASKRPVPVAEKIVPNKPLQFRLDKLQKDHPYLTERGLSPETIAEFAIGFCSKGTMAEHIAIPIRNAEGAVVAYAGRFPGDSSEDTPKYKLPQGFRKSLELFNLDRALKEPKELPLVIVEGFFDCMKLHQLGCQKTVALMGSSMSAAQEELIRTYADRTEHVIIMLDEDDAGRTGREDIAVRLSRFAFVKVHIFAEVGRQPENLSAEEVQALIGGA
jgi:DNA primase